MELLDNLIALDKQVLIFVQSFGSPFWDKFWLIVTSPFNWIPFFIFLYILCYKAYGLKTSIILAVTAAVCAKVTLMVVNTIKETVKRVRPLNDDSLGDGIKQLLQHSDYSFVSGHASDSFAIGFLTYWVLKPHYKYAYLVFIFPILFSFSRIYLAAHYPLDVLSGMLLGLIMAKIFYIPLKKFVLKPKTTSP